MSAIPPSIPASIIQTAQAQQQATGIQKAETDSQDQAFRSEIRAVEQRDGTVFSGDEDTRVNADGGGTGGQGRPFREAGEEATAQQGNAVGEEGITVDELGRTHLDLEA
ncbi:MAG TPA: hypothetical protein PLC79_05055 [Phycisphaerae bacterium]|nr:hypothetical protein [Phycisphaerae bacterium]